jgi:hypothetical protein
MDIKRQECLSEADVVRNKSGTGEACRHVQAKEAKHGLVDIPEASEK